MTAESEEAQLADEVNVPIEAIQVIDPEVVASMHLQSTIINHKSPKTYMRQQNFLQGPMWYGSKPTEPASGPAQPGSRPIAMA